MAKIMLSALLIWGASIVLLGFGTPPFDNQRSQGRAPAFFTHDNHMDMLDCKDCHHRYENGENVLDEYELDGSEEMLCRTCHNAGTSSTSEMGAMEAFHTQCMGCHRNYHKNGEPSGPRTCGTCHPREMPDDYSVLLIQ
ncbi:MAG: cytochrome c3 family protein [Desulfamplus sp.]|nr:cytochrome c3 family protein [Desulfamplus sp.]